MRSVENEKEAFFSTWRNNSRTCSAALPSFLDTTVTHSVPPMTFRAVASGGVLPADVLAGFVVAFGLGGTADLRNEPHSSQRSSTAQAQAPSFTNTMALSTSTSSTASSSPQFAQSEASVVIVTCGDSVSKAEDVCKLSTWRKLKTHLRRRRASRQVEDTSRRLEKTKKEKKTKRVATFIRAFLDAACPPVPTPAPPGPETFVRMPLAYRQKDHPGVLVAGRRVPFSIHMHLGRKSDLCSTLEAISEEEEEHR